MPYASSGVGESVENGGEIFNDYDKNIAMGKYSSASGHQSTILEGVAISNQEIDYVEYANNILTLTATDDFFDTANLWGFRIENKNSKIQSDVLKVLNSEHVGGDVWNFKIETPIDALNLGTPNGISIMALVNADETSEYSHAEGWGNIVIGRASHAEGWNNKVIDNYGHAEGAHNIAGYLAHAEGTQTQATAKYSHAEGALTTAQGVYSHAEGYQTTASASTAHAEGNETTASGLTAHAEGSGTIADGECSHAEGFNTKAMGKYSHAEGYGSSASGSYSHSEGVSTEAGAGAHAEGIYTKALGEHSHAEGVGTQTNTSDQHVQGRYNEFDEEGKYAHIVGGGTSSGNRKNIHTLDWNGNAMFAGNIIFNYKGKTYNLGEVLESLEKLTDLVDGNEVAY